MCSVVICKIDHTTQLQGCQQHFRVNSIANEFRLIPAFDFKGV